MTETLLNAMGWEALANIRLRRLVEVNAENLRLRAALRGTVMPLLRAANLLDDRGHDDAEKECWAAHQAACEALADEQKPDVTKIFTPLPEDEAAIMRELWDDPADKP